MKPSALTLELASIQSTLLRIESRLAPTPPVTTAPTLEKNALTVKEFLGELQARGIRRGRDWLGDQLRSRKIKRLALGKPFLIPRSELGRITTLLQHG